MYRTCCLYVIIHNNNRNVSIVFVSFLQQPSEGTTFEGSGDGESTDIGKGKENHVRLIFFFVQFCFCFNQVRD